MFCAECRVLQATASAENTRFGKAAVHCSACMPPIEPPTTQNRVSMPRRSISMACARTMSGMVMTGKSSPHSLPVAGLVEAGSGRAHAAADHVRTNDEISVGVERSPGAHHGLPPARLAGDRMNIGDMLIAGQRMQDQNRVGALRIEFAIGIVGDLERRQIDAAVELQRLLRAERRQQRTRIIRLMRAILRMNRRARYRLHLDHPGTALPSEASQTQLPKSGHKKPGLNTGSAGITSVPGLFSELFNVAASRPAQMTTERSES